MKYMIRKLLPICCLFISAEVQAFNCTITTTPVIFGVYDVFATLPLDSTGSVTVNCKNPDRKPLPITVYISQGRAGSFSPRQMSSSLGDSLNYYLFLDPSRTVVWGDGTGGSSFVTAIVSRDIILNSIIYSRVPPGQNVSAGIYSDTLTATVNW